MPDENGRVPIHVAMARVAADIGAVAKNLKNTQAGYAARSIDDVLDKVHDPLTAHGIVLLPTVKRAQYRDVTVGKNATPIREASLTIEWRFIGPMGDSVTATTCGEALDSGDKATNKAQSAALKYALLHVFTIPISSGDREADADDPRRVAPVPSEPAAPSTSQLLVKLNRAIEERGLPDGVPWPIPHDPAPSPDQLVAWLNQVLAQPRETPPPERVRPTLPLAQPPAEPAPGLDGHPWERRTFPALGPPDQIARWWKVAIADLPGVGPGKLLTAARDIAVAQNIPIPSALEDVRDAELVEAVRVWLNHRADDVGVDQ